MNRIDSAATLTAVWMISGLLGGVFVAKYLVEAKSQTSSAESLELAMLETFTNTCVVADTGMG